MKKLLYILLAFVLFSSCQKRYDEKLTVFEINLRNPVADVGWAGLRINVVEIQYEKNKPEVREIICSALTDEQGFARVSFNRATYHDLSRKDTDYEITFDKTMIDAPAGDYYSTIPAGFIKPTFGEKIVWDMDFIPHGMKVRHVKNINCFDENDVMMFKQIRVHTGSYKDFSQLDWSGGGFYVGCIDHDITSGGPSDISIFQIKVTRNNIDSIYYDTFINHPYVTDTFKIWY